MGSPDPRLPVSALICCLTLSLHFVSTSFNMPKKANIFDQFSHSALQQFKEAFGIMDVDKDGLLSASDLVAAFGNHGKSISSGEAQGMLDEADGPMNFTQMVTLFAGKMAGGADDDETILKSFDAFGNKFSASEVDDAFAEFKIDGGMIDAAHLKGLMVSKITETFRYTGSHVDLGVLN